MYTGIRTRNDPGIQSAGAGRRPIVATLAVIRHWHRGPCGGAWKLHLAVAVVVLKRVRGRVAERIHAFLLTCGPKPIGRVDHRDVNAVMHLQLGLGLGPGVKKEDVIEVATQRVDMFGDWVRVGVTVERCLMIERRLARFVWDILEPRLVPLHQPVEGIFTRPPDIDLLALVAVPHMHQSILFQNRKCLFRAPSYYEQRTAPVLAEHLPTKKEEVLGAEGLAGISLRDGVGDLNGILCDFCPRLPTARQQTGVWRWNGQA
jgi:hypothetical protein